MKPILVTHPRVTHTTDFLQEGMGYALLRPHGERPVGPAGKGQWGTRLGTSEDTHDVVPKVSYPELCLHSLSGLVGAGESREGEEDLSQELQASRTDYTPVEDIGSTPPPNQTKQNFHASVRRVELSPTPNPHPSPTSPSPGQLPPRRTQLVRVNAGSVQLESA